MNLMQSIRTMWGKQTVPPVRAAIAPDSSFGVLMRGNEVVMHLDAAALDELEHALQARRAALRDAEKTSKRAAS